MIFARSGDQYKAIVFTHHPSTNGIKNEKLKHNVDPDSNDDCYGVPYRGPRPRSDFQPPKAKYRVHKEDKPKVKQLKSGIKKRR